MCRVAKRHTVTHGNVVHKGWPLSPCLKHDNRAPEGTSRKHRQRKSSQVWAEMLLPALLAGLLLQVCTACARLQRSPMRNEAVRATTVM